MQQINTVQLVSDVFNKIVSDVKDNKIFRSLHCVSKYTQNTTINNIIHIDYDINIRFLFCESNDTLYWKYPNLKQISGNVIFDMNDTRYVNYLVSCDRMKNEDGKQTTYNDVMENIICHIRKLKNLTLIITVNSLLPGLQLIKLSTTMTCLKIDFNKMHWKSIKFINDSVLVTLNSISFHKTKLLLNVLKNMKTQLRFVIDINDSMIDYSAKHYIGSLLRAYDVYLSVPNILISNILLELEPSIIYDYVDVLKSTTGYLMVNRTIYLKHTPSQEDLVKLTSLFVESTFLTM